MLITRFKAKFQFKLDLPGTGTELSLAIVSYYLDILDGRIEIRFIEGNLAVISLFNYLKDFCIVSSKIMLLTSLFSPCITTFQSIVDILKGVQKKPNKSLDLFLCLNPRFWDRKWVLVGKIHFSSLFIL